MLKINQAVKLIENNSRREASVDEYIGFIKAIYKDFIVIELKNYNTCLNKADLIEDTGLRLQMSGKKFLKGLKFQMDQRIGIYINLIRREKRIGALRKVHRRIKDEVLL